MKIMQVLGSVFLIGVVFLTSAQSAELSDGYYLTTTDSTFDDAVSDLENAVIDKGLVIDHKGFVGDMLTRTEEATNQISPYKDAEYMQFCSAKLTHAAAKADARNLAICPYLVFVYETKNDDGKVMIGYRRPIGVSSPASDAALANIEKLLKELVDTAAEGL